MSEFLAEARILVRPDTTGFRAELEAALATATKPITIPVTPVVVGGTGAAGLAATTASAQAAAAAQHSVAAAAQEAGASAATAAVQTVKLAAADESAAVAGSALDAALKQQAVNSQALNAALNGVFLSSEKVAVAQTEAAAAITATSAAQTRALGQATKGIIAQGASLLGLRAGTLAASSGFIAGTVAVLAFAKAVESAAKLETELNVFQVTAGATADQMARVSDEAKALGKDLTLPGVTANDAAVALTELSKSGLSVQDSLDGARGSLQLATAAQIDNVTATKLVAGALNAFNLAGTESVRVADLLTGAAKESQGEIGDMGTALSQVAAVSKQFGVSIGDTVTLLTELAQAGLSGGRAGTSLRVAFLRLVNPTAAAQRELDKLNITVRDANGNLKPTVFTDITDALQGYSKAQRDAALATIFGSDAIRSAAIIGNKGALAFLQTSQAVNEVGLAQQQAAARTKGLQGDTENLKNQISSLGLTLGQVASGPSSLFVKALAGIASEANVAAEGIVLLGAKVGKLGGDIGGSIPFIDRFEKHLGTLAKIGALMDPVGRAFVVTAEGAKLLGVESGKAKPQTDAYGNSIDGIGAALSDLSKNLLQSAADSHAFTQQVTTDTANLLQSAADSRIGSNANRAKLPPAQFPVQRIQNIVQGFDDKQVRDKIAGDNKKLVADLQAEQAFLISELQKAGVQNRPALKRALEQSLLGVVNEIDSIQAQAKSGTKKATTSLKKTAADAARAISEANQATLNAFSQAREQRQNRIDADAVKGNLAQQVKDENVLAALVKQQIASIKTRIKGAADQKAALILLTGIQNQVNATQKTLLAQQQQAAADRHALVVQSIDLDVQLDQITGNQQKEVADRNKKIAALNKELAAEAKLHGKNTIAYKEIRNQIAEETAAINAITKEKQKQNNSFAQATFEFLQTQQGFASNLLGNLIPTSATSGLVGGQSPVQSALNPVSSFADGQAKSGPTAGQAQTTNSILLGILQQLKHLNGDNSAPEATRQKVGQRAVMDGVGGG